MTKGAPGTQSIQDLLNLTERVTTFAAGPTKLAREVKEKIVSDIIDYDETGIGILEYSHRSKTFGKVLQDAEVLLRDMLQIPSDYHVLFLQGGATGQFASIPMNLFGKAKTNPPKADYLVTGTWSAKAVKEAQRYGKIREICPRVDKFRAIPDPSTFEFDPEAEYFFFCDNETVHGLEFTEESMPKPPDGVPIVCDMSSNLLSKPVNISKFDLIFAGAQKNMGCPGVTVVIIKSSLLDRSLSYCPGILEYRTQIENKSMYNTPPTFNIYLTSKVCEWTVKEIGDLKAVDELCKRRSQKIYALIDESNGFYEPHVTNKEHRSRLNIIVSCADKSLNDLWLKEAADRGLLNLNGHRSIGGLRISLYNAINMREVGKLAKFMREFQNSYKPIKQK